MYVHCFLLVCKTSDPVSRCSEGCVPAISKRDVDGISRTTRSQSKSYVMTQGPLVFSDHADGMKNGEEFKTSKRGKGASYMPSWKAGHFCANLCEEDRQLG